MNQKGFTNIILIILVVILAGVVGYLTLIKNPTPPVTTNQTPPANTPIKQTPSVTLPTRTTKKVIKFSGEVKRGENFEKEISNNLVFRLRPIELGWEIFVGYKRSKPNIEPIRDEEDANFAIVVTPPFRGINHLDIEGWHFRNADNTGPNEPGPKNVNAPGDIRKFYFVLNNSDYQKAGKALDRLLWPYSYSEQKVKEAEFILSKLKRGYGILTIQDLKLNNLMPGQQAGIDWMKFDVELHFPE